MKQHLNHITSILKDDEKYMEQVNADVLMFYPKYKKWLLNGFNAIEIKKNIKTIYHIARSLITTNFKPNLKIAMHQIREESTRWALIRALKLISKSNL